MGKLRRNKETGRVTYLSNSGVELPSVTTVIQILSSSESLMGWANSLGFKRISIKNEQNRVMNIGTITHNYISEYLTGEESKYYNPDNYSEHEHQVASTCIDNFSTWFKTVEKKFNLIFSEKSFVSDKNNYGGTIDLFAEINEKNVLIDFKTSNYFSKSYFVQLAAYAFMMEEKGYEVDEVQVIKIAKKDNSVETFVMDRKDLDAYFDVFKAALTLYNLNKQTEIPYKEAFIANKNKKKQKTSDVKVSAKKKEVKKEEVIEKPKKKKTTKTEKVEEQPAKKKKTTKSK